MLSKLQVGNVFKYSEYDVQPWFIVISVGERTGFFFAKTKELTSPIVFDFFAPGVEVINYHRVTGT